MNIFSKNSSIEMIRAIIVDDEPHIRQTIRKMVHATCPNVEVIDEANSVETGVDSIHNGHPDLVFLDIKLDDGTGFDLLEKLAPIDFKVIFITAWDGYAIKAFKFSAVDYLLKPIDPDELKMAVEKAGKIIQHDFNTQLSNLNDHLTSQDRGNKKIIVRTAESIYLLHVNQILGCESSGNYTTIYLVDNRKIVVSNTLREYEELLIDYGFFRVHKSFLINLKYIARFDKSEGGCVVLVNDMKIPVASRKREHLLEMFDRLVQNS
jgi:two-component system LytT family response regulator